MTCVATSPLQLVGAGYDWSPMSAYQSMNMAQGMDSQQHEYASSAESEPRRGSSGSGKKRPSRAGTRSVSTLSAAQLERKRANDREAQRAIRQRTKDHISSLEKNITDLRVAQETSDKILAVTRQRNRELEDEVFHLRNRLGEVPFSATVRSRLDPSRMSDPAVPAIPSASPSTQTSGASIARSDSTALSVANSQSSGSRHGSWQQGQPAFTPNAPVASANLPTAAPVQVGHGLSTWPSHDSTQSMQSASSQLQDPTQSQGQTPYSAATPTERAPWSDAAQAYPYADQSRPQHFQTSPSTQQQYSAQAYQTPQAPPQAEFQALNVSSPTAYQMPAAQSFPPAPQYPINPMGIPSDSQEYTAAAHGQMQPPPLPGAHFHPAASGQPYNTQQQQQQQMQFRDQSGGRPFSLSHYSSG